MARVKFTLPDHPPCFKTTLTVRIGDLNYGAHVGNDTILSFAHEVRVRWLSAKNYSELDIEGVGLIMSDAMIMYQGEAFLADEIEALLYLSDISERAFDLYFQFVRVKDGKQVARLKLGHVFFDYQKRSIAKAGPNILRALEVPCPF